MGVKTKKAEDGGSNLLGGDCDVNGRSMEGRMRDDQRNVTVIVANTTVLLLVSGVKDDTVFGLCKYVWLARHIRRGRH